MFFSNNLLFLMSLAMVSWVLLCYLNEIDESRQLTYQLKYRYYGNISERTLEDDLLNELPNIQNNYQTFLTFFCVLTGSLLLVRLVLWTEKSCYTQLRTKLEELQRKTGFGFNFGNMKTHMKSKKKSYHAINVARETFTLDDYRKLSESLHEQSIKLQQRNSFLESRIRALEQQNLLLMGKGLLRTRGSNFHYDEHGNLVLKNSSKHNLFEVNGCGDHDQSNEKVCAGIVYSFLSEDDNGAHEAASEASIDQDCTLFENGQMMPVTFKRRSRRRNIFIANRFFHINRQVYVMEGNVKLHFGNLDGGDFTQMWQKYFELQRMSKNMRSSSKTNTTTPKNDESMYSNFSETTATTTATGPSTDVTENAYTTVDESISIYATEVGNEMNAKDSLPKIVSTEQLEAIHGLVQ